jgi:uncharacterized protein (TIGR04222 family)
MTTAQANLEELGFLAGGPARATEVAIARLLDADLIRISREGWVSAVNGRGRPFSPLEAYILNGLRHGSASLHDVAQAAMTSPEADGLRQHLISRELLRTKKRRFKLYPWLFIGAALLIFGGVDDGWRPDLLGAGAAVVVLALVLMNRDTGNLTRTGHTTLNGMTPRERLGFAAVHGLRGKAGLHGKVAAMFGLPDSVVRTLPNTKKTGDSSCGSGGSGCGSSCGSSCGGGGCGGGGGD